MKLTSLLPALILTLSSVLAGRAQSTFSLATPITVPNGSFESSYGSTQNNPDIATGWVFNVSGGSGYGVGSISPNYSSEGAASGSNFAYIVNNAPNEIGSITSAASLGVITANTTYTLSVAVGNPSTPDTEPYGQTGPVVFSLLANGKVVASKEIPSGAIPNGTFENFSLSYAPPATGSVVGDSLTIQLVSMPVHGTECLPGFDNVQLDETTIEAVPEPSTLLLLGVAGLGLWWLMSRRNRPSCFRPMHGAAALVAACFFVGGQQLASAASVVIPNSSFESPGSPSQTDHNPDLISGWVFQGAPGSYYGVASIASNFTASGTSTGSYYAFLNNDDPGYGGSITSASSLGPITADTTYTLTVAFGNIEKSDSSSYGSPGSTDFSLLANGQVYATETVPFGSVPNDSWEDFTLTYTTVANDPIVGEDLTIQLGAQPQYSGASQPAFDNVRLDETAVATAPEPTTFSLFVLAGSALGWLITRRRSAVSVPATVALAAVCILVGSMATVFADPVGVPNGSFETSSSGGGWTYNNPGILDDWVFNAPEGSAYGSLWLAFFNAPGSSTGGQCAFIENTSPGQEATVTSASPLGIIAANTIYTLSLAVGNADLNDPGLSSGPLDFDPIANTPPGNVTLSLLADGQPFATDLISTESVASGSFQDFSFSYATSASDSLIGQALTIEFGIESDSQPSVAASFDNVRLDATTNDIVSDGVSDPDSNSGTAPEPSSCGLLGLGLTALGWLTSRGRIQRDSLL